MTARVVRWGLSACIVVVAPLVLGGCFGVADGTVASVEPVDVRSSVATEDARPAIRTVRRSGVGAQVADAGDTGPRIAALPTPSEIFDFHPAGSKPDSWRQPFIIDPNDGPLAGYVRRMDAELKDSNQQTRAVANAPARKKVCPSDGPAGSISAACGENEVAKSLAR